MRTQKGAHKKKARTKEFIKQKSVVKSQASTVMIILVDNDKKVQLEGTCKNIGTFYLQKCKNISF